MGFLNDILGISSKPRVTKDEFKKVRSDLASHGMNERQRDKVESIFSGDMYEKATETHPTGIEKDEMEMRIKWMRENKDKHSLSDKQIDEVEASLRKRL